jgi:hypothetical protein
MPGTLGIAGRAGGTAGATAFDGERFGAVRAAVDAVDMEAAAPVALAIGIWPPNAARADDAPEIAGKPGAFACSGGTLSRAGGGGRKVVDNPPLGRWPSVGLEAGDDCPARTARAWPFVAAPRPGSPVDIGDIEPGTSGVA